MSQLPIVAIVGRPNVGKSTLFNRYARRRRAIVENVPGMTRDRLVEEAEVGDRRVLIVDTAGLDAEPESAVDAAVQGQARAALEQADALLFVVDGQAGLLPQDAELARLLRRTRKPLALAVNKIDVPAHAVRTAEFHALGFDHLAGVSAEHGTGAWDLLEALVAELPEMPEPEPQPEGTIRVAIVGRPNAGKSSLLNQLVGEERVVVSEVPGTTRDAIDISVERDGSHFVFVDTAGLRRSARRDRLGERTSALMAIRAVERADVALVLIDAADGFGDQDARILSMVRDRGCAAVIVLNKWDLVTEEGEAHLSNELDRRLKSFSHHPLLRVSAKTGRGIRRLLPTVLHLGKEVRRRIPTSELNRWLADSVARHEPAMAQRGTRRRPLKFFYATQPAVRPPTFILFCTDPDSIQDSYKRFLENRLRETFGFDGVPIRVRLRARREE